MLLINSSRNRGIAGDKLLDGVTERETWRRQGAGVGYQEHGQTALLGKWDVLRCGLGRIVRLWAVDCGGREKVGKSERGEKGTECRLAPNLVPSAPLVPSQLYKYIGGTLTYSPFQALT